MSDTPFGAVPPGADFLAQQSAAYQSDEQARSLAADEAAAAVPAPVDVDPYEPYREHEFQVWKGDKPYTASLDQMLQMRGGKDPDGHPFDDYKLSVVAPDGARRGIALSQVDQALADGFKLENAQQSRVSQAVEENNGIKGTVRAAVLGASDELAFGVPQVIFDRTSTPETRAQQEAILNEHEFAHYAGKAAGFLGSIFTGGAELKGARSLFGYVDAGGRAAQGALAKVLGSRVAQITGEKGTEYVGKTLASKILLGAGKLGTESAIMAAPQAVTEAALGDPDDAAETLVYAFGAGAALGAGGAGAKALLGRVFRGVGSGAQAARDADAVASVDAEMSPEAAKAAWDEKFAKAQAESGGATKAVDAVGESYARQFKSMPEKQQEALAYALKNNVTKGIERNDLLNDVSTELKNTLDVALRADEDITPRIAFGEGKAEQMAKLVPADKAEAQLSRVVQMHREVEATAKFLDGLSDKGGSAATVKKLQQSLESFNQKWEHSASTTYDYETARDAYMYADKLKREVGKASGMGKSPMMRTDAEKEAFDLYHKLIPYLEDEAVWGAAGKAQREVNAATSKKLGLANRFASGFLADDESQAGNRFREFDAGKIKSYLKQILDVESKGSEKGLHNWFDGVRNQIEAVEGNYAVGSGDKEAFKAALSSIDKAERDLAAARRDAGHIRTYESMLQHERDAGTANFLGLGAISDIAFKPATTIGRMQHVRDVAHRLEKSGILVTEQAQRKACDKLDEVPNVLQRMASGTKRVDGEKLTGRAIASLIGEHTSTAKREDQYRALQGKLAAAQANPQATTERIANQAHLLNTYGAPNVGQAYVVKQQQILAYLAREMPRAPQRQAFGPKHDETPSSRDIIEYERKVEAAHDPIGCVSRHLEDGTLTRTHVRAIEENYPGTLRKIRQRILDAAGQPSAPQLSAVQRSRLAVLMGESAARPQDKARYQAPYTQPVKSDPSRAGVDMPDPQTDTQRISTK